MEGGLRQSADLHQVCQKVLTQGAPFLRKQGTCSRAYCLQEIPGAWYIVVMGDLDIDPYSCISSYKQFVPCFYPPSDLKRMEEAVTALISDLHNEGYMHGDLWDVNLFVRCNGQDKTKDFMLIDFDWAGEVHKTRYPRLMNREMVHRPSGAQNGMEILKDHDLEMLHVLFHPYSWWLPGALDSITVINWHLRHENCEGSVCNTTQN